MTASSSDTGEDESAGDSEDSQLAEYVEGILDEQEDIPEGFVPGAMEHLAMSPFHPMWVYLLQTLFPDHHESVQQCVTLSLSLLLFPLFSWSAEFWRQAASDPPASKCKSLHWRWWKSPNRQCVCTATMPPCLSGLQPG